MDKPKSEAVSRSVQLGRRQVLKEICGSGLVALFPALGIGACTRDEGGGQSGLGGAGAGGPEPEGTTSRAPGVGGSSSSRQTASNVNVGGTSRSEPGANNVGGSQASSSWLVSRERRPA